MQQLIKLKKKETGTKLYIYFTECGLRDKYTNPVVKCPANVQM